MRPPFIKPVYSRLRVDRVSFELAWAAICPPLVATLVALAADALWGNDFRENSTTSTVSTLIPLMVGGMAVLSAVIFLDRRAVESFRSRADGLRITLGFSTAITLIFLSVIVTAQTERGDEGAALVLFLCLPVLFTCGALLWHAATMLRSSFYRGLMLTGFVIITALVELLSAQKINRGVEERLFMLNSLLVALAFAIQLSVWSTRALRRR